MMKCIRLNGIGLKLKIKFFSINDKKFVLKQQLTFSSKNNNNNSQKELYESYNRLILDIEKKRVDTSLERIYMKQLLEYLEELNHDKTKLKGWAYLGNYFYTNLEQLNDDDFLKYFIKFIHFQFKGTQNDFWDKTVNYLINKKIVRHQFISLVFPLSKLNTSIINWEKIADHLLKFNNLNFQDASILVILLFKIDFDLKHPIWPHVLSSFNKIIYEECDKKTLINLMTLLIQKMGFEIINKCVHDFKSYYISNIDKFDLIMKVKLSIILGNKKILSEEEMSLLILNIFPNIDKISTEESNDFLIMVMSYFDNKNRFENILKKVESEYSKKYGKGTNYNNEFVQNLIKSLNSKFDKI